MLICCIAFVSCKKDEVIKPKPIAVASPLPCVMLLLSVQLVVY